MNKQEIFVFIIQHTIGYLETIRDKAAKVHGMETFRANEKGLIFYTGKIKEIFKQIYKNPEIRKKD